MSRRLGTETDTLDAEGTVIRTSPVDVSERQLRDAMGAFVGEIEQRPPAYSAVKVGGERLHRAARRGKAIEAPSRRVRVDTFDLTRFDRPDFDFRVVSSSGTYVRSLVADVGTKLGPGAHLTRLVRTRIGPFQLGDASPPDAPGEPLPLERAVSHLPRLEVDDEEARAAAHGRCLAPSRNDGPYGVFGPDSRLIGVFRDNRRQVLPPGRVDPGAGLTGSRTPTRGPLRRGRPLPRNP